MGMTEDAGAGNSRWLEGGEAGELIRDHDWASTPLGPAAQWPHSLRTAVNLMLNSRHPMWIGWGPEASFLYNDAYVSVLGQAKHPWALGRPAAEVWAEIWDVCGPLADKVFQRGEASFVDDVRLLMWRGDFLEETFYSFSYSPIRDESGQVAGLFCPSTETTDKILNARRLATLSSLAAKATVETTTLGACDTAMRIIGENADDIPFALLYLLENDRLVLQRSVGLDAQPPAFRPERVEPEADADASAVWPLAAVIAQGQPQTCALAQGLTVNGIGDQPVREAIVLPVASSQQEKPIGVLVAGVSAARRLDLEYRTFFTLVAGQIATAIANSQAYEAERRRAEALAELDRAKTLFFSNVSHELRTPLTLLLSPLDEVLEGTVESAQRERLQMARRNAHRLQKLVNTLLDFSRIEAGRTRAFYEATDLALLTAQLASSFRSTIERAGLRLTVDCEPLAEPVFVDRDMWEKVVLNLLSNAFKFTFEGEVRLSLRGSGSAVELVVADTGVGIPADQIPRLFERFFRVEGARARTHEGSGIGLALVRELVKLHGGRIEVDSVENYGSTFTVRLPTGSAHLPAEHLGKRRDNRPDTAARVETYVDEARLWINPASTPPAMRAPSGRIAQAPRPRVLLADDNADMRDYVRSLLSAQHEVSCVADGLAAWQALQGELPDLLLTDVMMPGLDGFGLLRRIRADARLRELPVMLLSARAGEESRVEGLNAGADDYLVKPFAAKELLARVESQITLARLRREARVEAETLNEVSRSLIELDMQVLVQKITDAGTELTGARFGAFFYNMIDENGAAYQLYTLSGAPREAFENFGHPRATPVFAPTFNGEGVIRSDDVTEDSRYGHWGPHFGQPQGHLPVRSYLAVPVVSRSGQVIGGLFFGHPEPGVFDERSERLITGIAGQASAALDNARLFDEVQRAAKERESLLQSERAARGEAERLSAIKDEFLATLSHELRTPLNAILGWAQILAGRNARSDDLQRGAEAIYRNARAQAMLIEDLLDMSRITSGKLRLDVQTVAPMSFIEAATEAVRPAAEAKNIRIEMIVDPLAGPVSGDAGRLQQVVWNLLSNAIKYTPKGGKVQVLLERINSHIEISVADTGIGIAADFLPYVFERFRQADASTTRRFGGLGLGLAIVKHLVELHGGTVQARSAGADQGATFTVCLPLSVLHRPAEAERVHPRASAGEPVDVRSVDLSGLRVLVVDDDRDARELIEHALSDCGAEVLSVDSGAEALRVIEGLRPQLLISDIGMPNMDGYELLKRVRALPEVIAGLRPIALTAFARTEDRTRAMLAGFHMHLSKPVEPAELIATVAAMAGRAQL
jgi:signal transduction histidine kinase/DNA-binding response OmpR family regulator